MQHRNNQDNFNLAAVYIVAPKADTPCDLGAGRRLPSTRRVAAAWWADSLQRTHDVVDLVLGCDLRPRSAPGQHVCRHRARGEHGHRGGRGPASRSVWSSTLPVVGRASGCVGERRDRPRQCRMGSYRTSIANFAVAGSRLRHGAHPIQTLGALSGCKTVPVPPDGHPPISVSFTAARLFYGRQHSPWSGPDRRP
jgi:hypothetical protein